MNSSRRRMLSASMATLAAAGLPRPIFGLPRQNTVPDSFPRHDPAAVQQVVGLSHFNLERVTEIVTARPELAKAAWDWGYGDWETALGAASHTGNHAIAELLIAHGAPPTLYSAAALGQLDVVKSIVESTPGAHTQPGPHGIPLLEHARLAGDRARAVYEYLERIGGANTQSTSQPYGALTRESFFGVYRFGPGPEDYLEGYDQRGALMLRRGEQTGRALTHLGNYVFHPAGAQSVRIEFTVENGQPVRLTVHDPDPIVTAVRER